jgi:hypothetical protein
MGNSIPLLNLTVGALITFNAITAVVNGRHLTTPDSNLTHALSMPNVIGRFKTIHVLFNGEWMK